MIFNNIFSIILGIEKVFKCKEIKSTDLISYLLINSKVNTFFYYYMYAVSYLLLLINLNLLIFINYTVNVRY